MPVKKRNRNVVESASSKSLTRAEIERAEQAPRPAFDSTGILPPLIDLCQWMISRTPRLPEFAARHDAIVFEALNYDFWADKAATLASPQERSRLLLSGRFEHKESDYIKQVLSNVKDRESLLASVGSVELNERESMARGAFDEMRRVEQGRLHEDLITSSLGAVEAYEARQLSKHLHPFMELTHHKLLSKFSRLNIEDYLSLSLTASHIRDEAYVVTYIYIRRFFDAISQKARAASDLQGHRHKFMNSDPAFLFAYCGHKVLLAAYDVALLWLYDEKVPPMSQAPNTYVTPNEMSELQRSFLKIIDYKTFVNEDEFESAKRTMKSLFRTFRTDIAGGKLAPAYVYQVNLQESVDLDEYSDDSMSRYERANEAHMAWMNELVWDVQWNPKGTSVLNRRDILVEPNGLWSQRGAASDLALQLAPAMTFNARAATTQQNYQKVHDQIVELGVWDSALPLAAAQIPVAQSSVATA